MSRASRGMIQVGGVTYRIERCAPHRYSVVRLLDDLEVGTFRTFPNLRIHPVHVELGLFRALVRAALHSARTSAVMHAAPVFKPDDETPASSGRGRGPATHATENRPPSSLPPRTPLLV